MIQHLQELIVVGTRQHHGVAGCMADGLSSKGHDVRFIELYPANWPTFTDRVVRRLVPNLTRSERSGNRDLRNAVKRSRSRHVLVTNGWEISPDTIAECRECLERRGGGIACYLCDDPFNPLHRRQQWLAALREYSVVASTKSRVIPDLVANGCRKVVYSRFGYHPPIHTRVDWRGMGFDECDLAFAGNADTDRLPIMSALVDGLPQLRHRLYGGGWSQSNLLRPHAHGPVVGIQYSGAMSAATVCPCLVRRANRDGHVMRSFELPAIGAFMLAERTDEHQAMFDEGTHCEFWGSVDELIDKARWYCMHPGDARRIADQGHKFVTGGSNTYDARAIEVISAISS